MSHLEETVDLRSIIMPKDAVLCEVAFFFWDKEYKRVFCILNAAQGGCEGEGRSRIGGRGGRCCGGAGLGSQRTQPWKGAVRMEW